MMNGGQPISPGLLQALQNISTSQEDGQNLNKQLQMAQAMRSQGQTPTGTQMAGKVAIRNSPVAALGNVASNVLSDYKQNQVLQQMKAQVGALRDARGRILSDEAAQANFNSNPSANHPTTNAVLASASSPSEGDTPDMGLGMGGGNVDASIPDFN